MHRYLPRIACSVLQNSMYTSRLAMCNQISFSFSGSSTSHQQPQNKTTTILKGARVNPTSLKSECWNCNSRSFQSNLFVCGSCQHLQDPSQSITSMNFFKLFEMDLQFEIDQTVLSQRYKDLQKSFHPDKFHNMRNPKVIKFSETYSTYINEAYSTLKDDLKRGEYLLDLVSGGKKVDMESQIQSNQLFLNSVMMLRMEIEEAESESELEALKESLLTTQKQINLELQGHLRDANYQSATETLINLRYNQSSLNAIKERSEALAATRK